MTAARNVENRYDLAVCIGRFQPFHAGHLRLLQRALELAPHCVVVIGSAFQARTPKNPWTWQERAEMVRLALNDAERQRISFLPVRDYYDEARWVAAVRRGVADIAERTRHDRHAQVALAGHLQDANGDTARAFGDWHAVPIERDGPVDASHLRDALFNHGDGHVEASLAALVDAAPPSTLDFIRAWSALPYLPLLAEEWQALRRYHEAWSHTPFPSVFVTVDAVVRCAGQVLLIRRGTPPGKGLLAVPGGFIDVAETVYRSALRELREETGLSLLDSTMRDCLQAVAVFDHPERSQRGRIITHAHYFDLADRELPDVRGADDAASAQWIAIDDLAALEDQFHDDHFHMLDHFLNVTETR